MPKGEEGNNSAPHKAPLISAVHVWGALWAPTAFVWESLNVKLSRFAGACRPVREQCHYFWSVWVSGGWWRDACKGVGAVEGGRGSSPGWWLTPGSLPLQVDRWDEITGGSTGGLWRSAAFGAATWLCWKPTAPSPSSLSVTSPPPPWRACRRSTR